MDWELVMVEEEAMNLVAAHTVQLCCSPVLLQPLE